jgi:hypothetical protein
MLGKMLQMDYDALAAEDDCWRLVTISDRTAAICLSLLHYAHWTRRYYSSTNQEIDLDAVQAWASRAEAELQGDVSEVLSVCEDSVGICEQFKLCIVSGYLDDALQDWLNKHNLPPGTTETGTPDGTEAGVNLLASCDLDAIFGAVTQVVDYANDVIVDFYQALAAENNEAKLVALAISAVPIVGALLPVDEILEAVVFLKESLGSNYLAAYTEEVRLAYRCDLFCLAQEACSLNLRDMAVYFAGEIIEGILEKNIQGLIEYVLSGSWLGKEVVDVSHALVFFVLATGSEALGISPKVFTRLFAAMFNDPDPDWSVLCDECPQGWEIVLDVAVDSWDFVLFPGFNYHVEGVYDGEWKTSFGNDDAPPPFEPPATTTMLCIGRAFDCDTHLTFARIDFTNSNGGVWDTGAEVNNRMSIYWNGLQAGKTDVVVKDSKTTGDGAQYIENDCDLDVEAADVLTIQVITSVDYVSPIQEHGHAELGTITLRGTGERPNWGA